MKGTNKVMTVTGRQIKRREIAVKCRLMIAVTGRQIRRRDQRARR